MLVSAAHIPGVQADSLSQSFSEVVEWKLSTYLFQKFSRIIDNPTLKLFVSERNYQVGRYITLKRDLAAIAIEGFSIKWHTEFCYIVTRLSLLGKAAAKIHRDKTKVIVVISEWTTQCWYLILLERKTKNTTVTPTAKKLVQVQDLQKVYPLHRNLQL